MALIRGQIDERAEEKTRRKPARRFATGQSTQMIVGADTADDASIMRTSAKLYGGYRLKRVYYSAFSPIPDASSLLPLRAPPLQREHRLYQADWLLRYYGFGVEELAQATDDGMFDLSLDPKTSWALKNRALFPVDLNRAPREMLLRVPGLGVRVVDRLIAARRFAALRRGGELTASTIVFWQTGRDGVVPFWMEWIAFDVESGHFGVADFDALGIGVFIEFAADREAIFRRGCGDQFDNRRATR
jgi:predicted DNA-binding helix-hairpin-helix protein